MRQTFSQQINSGFKRSRTPLVVGAVLLLILSGGLFYFIITGKLRGSKVDLTPGPVTATTTVTLVPRHLDGVFVPQGEEALGIRAVMVENHPDARPLSGPALANVALEVPVEGGITRFLLLFDATTTAAEVGPVRSARPYFTDWVDGWHAAYFHVGGSPEALTKIRDLGRARFFDVDEIRYGSFFWRAAERFAPHNVYTNTERMMQATASTTIRQVTNWHFQDMVTSTQRGGVASVRIPYGGNYNTTWKYDKERGVYVRYQGAKAQTDKDGTAVESENVIVIKTDSQVLDKEGRLKVRTIGSGDALAYRDGNKYILRWRRSAGEPIRFEGTDGTEFMLTRGRTWIEVTTDDKIFAGLGN